MYRSSNVDIGGGGNNYLVAWTQAGEWLQYTVNVAASGTYTFETRAGAPSGGATFHVEMDGQNVTGAVALQNTGAFNQYQITSKAGVQLSAGQHTMRVVFDTNNQTTSYLGDFDWFRFTSGGSTTNVPRDGHQTLSYDTASNRITTGGFEYDAAGNQTKAVRADGSVQRMTYDAANRLVEVKNDANNVVYESYKYGVGNTRLVTESGGMRTYYAGGGQPGVEYVEATSGGSLTWSKSFIYMGGSLLATISPNGGGGEYVEYHHPDRLGTRLTTNNLNTSFYEQVTLPYGTALDAESTGATNRRFTSYDRSPSTGLDYAVNRRYDSQQGRFTQVDPIGAGASSLSDPQSWNLYAYCGNDPVNHVDPDGLFFKKLFRSIGRIVAKVLKWAAVVVAVALVVIAIGTGEPWLLAVSGLLFGVAFGGEAVQRVLSGVNLGLSAGSFSRIGIGGTASTFPGNSFQGRGEIVDYGDVINFPSKPAYDSYWAYLRAQVGAIGRGISNAIGNGASYGMYYHNRYRAWADPIVDRVLNGPPDSCFRTGQCIGGSITIVGPIVNPGGLGGAIASGRTGHDAFVKHALERGEFAGLGIRTRGQFADFVNGIQRNATGANIRSLSGGRTAFWDPSTGTVVILNPKVSDLGTAFRPTQGRSYFDSVLK